MSTIEQILAGVGLVGILGALGGGAALWRLLSRNAAPLPSRPDRTPEVSAAAREREAVAVVLRERLAASEHVDEIAHQTGDDRTKGIAAERARRRK